MTLSDLLKQLGTTAESIDRIRLGRGVVGRVSIVAGLALVVLGIVAWRINNVYLLFVTGMIALMLFVVYIRGILHFAEKNPAAAILEGSELLAWRQIDLAAKGLGTPAGLRVVDPSSSPPPALPPASEEVPE